MKWGTCTSYTLAWDYACDGVQMFHSQGSFNKAKSSHSCWLDSSYMPMLIAMCISHIQAHACGFVKQPHSTLPGTEPGIVHMMVRHVALQATKSNRQTKMKKAWDISSLQTRLALCQRMHQPHESWIMIEIARLVCCTAVDFRKHLSWAVIFVLSESSLMRSNCRGVFSRSSLIVEGWTWMPGGACTSLSSGSRAIATSLSQPRCQNCRWRESSKLKRTESVTCGLEWIYSQTRV